MSLQVRLRHALGERLIDLADRPAEHPLKIGRAREADVKIPSVTVGNEHCVLFVHEGQWVLQDTSGGMTYLNGSALEGPTPLCVGDVITLGSDGNPATLEIDPAGVAQGRTGYPVGTQVAAPAPAQVAVPPQISAVGAGGYTAAVPPQVVTSSTGWGQAAATEDDPFASWGQPAANDGNAQPATVRRKKAAKKSSDGPLIGGIAACLIVLGGTGWFAYHQLHRPVEVIKPAPVVEDYSGPRPHSMFDEPAPKKHSTPVSPPAPKRDTSPESSQTPDSTTDNSPRTPPTPDANSSTSADGEAHKNDPSWGEIEGAHYSPNYGLAIVKFDDYGREHNGAYAKELKAYTDEALDRLWWKRLAELCNRRVTLNADLRKKDVEIRQETSAQFKKTLEDEKKELNKQLAIAQSTLTDEMGFTSDEIPDPNDATMIGKLSAQRDADKFGEWKTRVLRFIRSHHGATPWDGDS